MGRQHTTWISEENWKKLENIPGKSVSSKIGNAIAMADPATNKWHAAKVRQLEQATKYLKAIADCRINHNGAGIMELLEDCAWIWLEASE